MGGFILFPVMIFRYVDYFFFFINLFFCPASYKGQTGELISFYSRRFKIIFVYNATFRTYIN